MSNEAPSDALRLVPDCQCNRCAQEAVDADGGSPFDPRLVRMFCCVQCGNKRCPHATDHRLSCTGSNEVGQEGSSYGPPLKSAAPASPLPGGGDMDWQSVAMWMGFAASVIKSGEPWSDQCQQHYDEAQAAFARLAAPTGEPK